MTTCRTCKHWTQRPLNPEVIGECKKLAVHQRGREAVISPVAFSLPPFYSRALTGDWFSCHFWEARHD